MYYIIHGLIGRKFYDTLEDLVRDNWMILWSYGDRHGIRAYDAYTCQPLDDGVLDDAVWAHRKKSIERYRRKKDYVFRRGPVPGINSRKWGRWYRRPHTKQELSQEIPTRDKRKDLPTSWDDIYSHSQKNWKFQRKTQWKAK